jgi:hypothetical protein
MPSSAHTWSFSRIGGFDQVRLESGADLLNLPSLDQKLWVALACPTTGLEFDPKTLNYIDSDQDGRIRASELIQAIQWAGSLLKNPDDLIRALPTLPLAAINDSTPEGATVLAAARQILVNLGQGNRTEISVEDTSEPAKIFAESRFNGDGVIPAVAADDAFTQGVIETIIKLYGPESDRSGKPGINQAKSDRFFAALVTYNDWARKYEEDASIRGPGESSGAYEAFHAVETKINDYFGRCRLAAFDPRALAALNRDEKEYHALTARDIGISAQELAGFPLARIGPGQALPLGAGLNPAWSAAIATFVQAVIRPLLGDVSELTETDWTKLISVFAPHTAWLAAKPVSEVSVLEISRIREILASDAQARINRLILTDKAEEQKASSVSAVDRLIRYQRDLYRLSANFVSFEDLYSGQRPAIFQAGTLYLDERSCQLCLTVGDSGRHATMVGLAGTYLAYCDCVRKVSGEKMQIVAAFTDGDSDNLMVGRNGVFYDRKGRDFDATIVKIVDNPISLRQAFWSPYKKFVRLIEEQIAKRAAAADTAATDKLAKAAETTANLDQAKAAPSKKVDVGTVAALGVAFGAIGGFFTAVVSTGSQIVSHGALAVVAAVIGIVLLISGPSLILAFIKLRKRNLGPILDANGWAINARARINIPFGTTLTQVPKLPPGSRHNLVDPFAEKTNPWPKRAVVLLVIYALFALLNHMGYISEWTGGRLGTPNENRNRTNGKAVADSTPATPSGTNAVAQ